MLQGLGPDGSTTWFAVNELGQYSGTNLFAGGDEPIVAFQVVSDVGWSLAVRPLSDARVWNTAQITGTGDDVLLLPDAPRGFSTVAIRASSEGHTGVWAYSDHSRDLLFNFVGAGAEETVLPSEAWLVSVGSNAAWSLSRG